MFGKPVDVIEGLETREILFFSAVLLNPKCQPRMGIPFLQNKYLRRQYKHRRGQGGCLIPFLKRDDEAKKCEERNIDYWPMARENMVEKMGWPGGELNFLIFQIFHYVHILVNFPMLANNLDFLKMIP